MTQYSAKELKLLQHFGLEPVQLGLLSVSVVYRFAMERAFAERIEGPETEILRRIYKGWVNGSVLRGSPEFEAFFDEPLVNRLTTHISHASSILEVLADEYDRQGYEDLARETRCIAAAQAQRLSALTKNGRT